MGEFDLYHVRDKQKREVDFLVTLNNEPFALIEVKLGQSTPTNALCYYKNLLNPKFCMQVVKSPQKERSTSLQYPGIRIISAQKFLGSLV